MIYNYMFLFAIQNALPIKILLHLLFFAPYLITVQRTVIVPPEEGYGPKGMSEIPVRTEIHCCIYSQMLQYDYHQLLWTLSQATELFIACYVFPINVIYIIELEPVPIYIYWH